MKANHNILRVAILTGCHRAQTIIPNQGLERQYREFCEAIAWMQAEGLVVYSNDNMACEYGYYLTAKGEAAL